MLTVTARKNMRNINLTKRQRIQPPKCLYGCKTIEYPLQSQAIKNNTTSEQDC